MWVNNSLFKISPKDIPALPVELSEESRTWWKEQRRRCIEGYWIGGKWMPGNLYFYINFWPILVNKDRFSKVKVQGMPELWDIVWDMAYGYIEARGFAGFSGMTPVQEYKELLHNKGIPMSEIRSAASKLGNPRDIMTNTTKEIGHPEMLHEAKNLMIMANRGCGKELADYEPLMTPNGEIQIGKCNIGDEIYGRNGQLTKVVNKFPQGEKDIYRFKFIDGRHIDCGLEHQWILYEGNIPRLITTKQLLAKSLKFKKSYRYALPDIDEVVYAEKELPIHPYVLGALLGDGTMTTATPKIASSDIEIIDRLKVLLSEYTLSYDISTSNNYTIVERDRFIESKIIGKNKFGANRLYRSIKELKLNVSCKNKFIPNIYKYCSIEQRYELVRGLMDTDGSITKNGHCEFSNTSKQLVEDLAYILRGLGIWCRIDIRDRTGQFNKMPQGTISERGVCYRLYIRTDKPIFYLPRKKNRLRTRTRSNKVSLVSIENIGKYSATCIMVDNKDKLFLTRDYIPTHNSYFVAGGVIAHGFLFDGLYEYKPANEVTESMQIAIGAGDAKYSTATLAKVKYGMERMPGGVKMGNDFYPCPFLKQYKGSFKLGGEVVATYSKQEGSNWKECGTGATIYHRTFRDNPFAFNGLRAGVGVLEEIGMFDNLIRSSGATEDVMKDGEYKFGTQVMVGTGGDMEGGTIDASRMFYDTDTYKLVSYDDIWEHKGKIALFIPTTRGTHQYKDSEGNTIMELAEAEDDKIREEIRKSKNASTAMDSRKQNQPRVPSEMFLSKTGNIFPRGELQEHLSAIESSEKLKLMEDVGELVFRDEGILKWEHLPKDRAVRVFPHDLMRDDCRGAMQIWHHPIRNDEGHTPSGLYIAGTDPYDHDSSGTMSLGSTLIYMKMAPGNVKETLVAEYTGRHEKGSDAYYEQVRRLLMYYNAKVMFENNLIGMYKYFERKNCTHMMMDTPEYAKEMGTQPNRPKGMHFGVPQIVHGELLIKNWLEEEIAPGVLQLTKIKSVALLKELIGYNRTGNFDRARALMCVMYAREETFRENPDLAAERVKTLADDPFFSRNYHTPNGKRKSIWDVQGTIDKFKGAV